MARTRSSAAKLTASSPDKPEPAVEEESPEVSGDDLDSARTPASFNGKLQKFQFDQTVQATTVNPSVASSSQPPAQSSPGKALKRTYSTSLTDDPPLTRTSSPTKKRRTPSKYAPPSKYAHLPPLQDILEPNLICVFVGTNPGLKTASAGHAYAHPSNLFWKLLHSSGCTDRRCAPEEDVDLPRLYAMGNTNIVERPSKDAAELSKAEMAAGTPILEAKFRKYKPEAVCIVGKGIWESIWRWRYGRNPTKEQFKYGWQDDKENMGVPEGGEEEGDASGKLWEGARVFVTTSTSGLSASTRPAEKEAIWKPFGEWVKKRREERLQRS